MKTRISGRWVVGHENGHSHPDHETARSSTRDTIVFVGRRFDGAVDRRIDATGKLVAPGFIDTHVHAGHRAAHRLITDTGRPMYYGQPFLEIRCRRKATWSTATRATSRSMAKRRRRRDPSALFTVAELLRNGVTTFVELRQPAHVQDALLAEVTRLGARAYLAPGYDLRPLGRRRAGPAEARAQRRAGPRRLQRLRCAWIERHDGAPADACAASWCRARSRPRASNC